MERDASRIGFWLLTSGVVLFSIPTLIIGFEQAKMAHNLGYWYTRQREALEPLKNLMWFRVLPDGMMIIGALVIFLDLVKKSMFSRKPPRPG